MKLFYIGGNPTLNRSMTSVSSMYFLIISKTSNFKIKMVQNQHHYLLANTSIPDYKTPDIDSSVMSHKTKKVGTVQDENNGTKQPTRDVIVD